MLLAQRFPSLKKGTEIRPPFISIALLSAVAIAYEILLMRLFSIIQWHHFAYMVISLALLGYGFSGTLISFIRDYLCRYFQVGYPLICSLFSISCWLAFQYAQSIPFNMEGLLWDAKQSLYLLSIFLLLSIPFLLVALAICLNLSYFSHHIGALYGADLIGAGLGSILIISLLFHFFPIAALGILTFLGLLTTIVAIWETGCFGRWSRFWLSGAFLLALAGYLLLTIPSLQLNISPYKSLSQTLNIQGSETVYETSGPLGHLSVISNSVIPFRHVPGLSLNNTQTPLSQLALFVDADSMSAITQYPKSISELNYLNQLSSALPFYLSPIESLLIVGAGGGGDILQAKINAVDVIDVVEHNPQMIEILTQHYAQYSGRLNEQEGVSIIEGDIRAYLEQNQKKYDLLQISLMDSFNASSSGLYALHESYLYTQEAIATYLQHINSAGFLAISRWVKVPPRDGLKMFATAIQTLKSRGVENPGQHLVLIRGWQTSTLLIKNSPITPTEIKRLKQFCSERSFDVSWYPGIRERETNRYNQLREAYFYQGAMALLSEQANEFITDYKYHITPASDNKPFFHHFFKWPLLLELIKMSDQGAVILLETGYVVIVTTLIIAIFISMGLIAIPLLKLSKIKPKQTVWLKKHLFLYFFSLGLAFLMIEIAIMQKFILFLHHPIYTIPVVLSAFLIFAGIGSMLTQALLKRISYRQLLLTAISLISIVSLFYIISLASLFNALMGFSLIFKIIIVLIIIAPLAIAMGMPFPIAVDYLGKHLPSYISWAWGINGYASVISAILATLLAIHIGFDSVILIAILLYGLSYRFFPQH